MIFYEINSLNWVNKAMIYYMECYNTMFHADSIGKMYKYSYIIKNMIENYEIESINLDIQYSKLIYGELNFLL